MNDWQRTNENLRAQRLDVLRHGNRFDAVWIVRVANAKGACFSALAKHGVTALDGVLLNEHLGSPLLNAGVHAQPFAVGGGADKAGVDLQQRRADRKSTRLNSSHLDLSRMPSSA